MKDGNPELRFVFEQLKAILKPYQDFLVISHEATGEYRLSTRFVMSNNQTLCFADIKLNTGGVSFHLMPVYVDPILLLDIGPELKQQMQSKANFYFDTLTPTLNAQLTRLVDLSFRSFQQQGYVAPMPTQALL